MTLHVVQLSSVHSWQDNRVFRRHSRSLARHGHQVTLLAAGGPVDEVVDGVHVIARPSGGGRLRRLLTDLPAVLRRARRLDADVYHLHDPELGLLIPFLRRRGAAVIYDAHEDLPSQVLAKPYLPAVLRPLVSLSSRLFLRLVDRTADHVVAATPTVARRFTPSATTVVHNYPELAAAAGESEPAPDLDVALYLGRVSRTRGIMTMLDALDRAPLPPSWRLSIVGPWASPELLEEVGRHRAADRIEIVGAVPPLQARRHIGRASVGLALLHPTVAYRDALPTKLFEYMAAGVPVIASDFPLWREIVEPARCGLLVDPQDPDAIAVALVEIASRPDEAREMGRRGRRAVEQLYSWEREEAHLVSAVAQAVAVRAAHVAVPRP